ncbi:MAG TPA: amidohydrolase family protein [Abditibacteriaceae bacterium]|nr:amidohydrolase family protein [Abditibacteriaceae bacterium]
MTIDACVTLGQERETVLSVADLLGQMDEADVERALVQPEDRALVVDNDEGNRAMLRAAEAHPDRLIATCTANPWHGPRAVEGVLRAIEQGARMVVFAPALQGFILGDEILFPVLDAVAEKCVPIYVHTGPHSHSTPWQLVNVAERYPTLPFIMGHSGATDYWTDVANAALASDNIYLEASFARPFIMLNHLKTVGMHRGIMGSAAPRNDLKFEWEQMRRVLAPEENEEYYGRTLLCLIEGVRP